MIFFRRLSRKPRACRFIIILSTSKYWVLIFNRFLAARLYVESLASKTNLRAVKKALRALPTTLDKNYDEAMERIKQHPNKTVAIWALTWVVYALRPLQLEEVQHAIAVEELEPEDQCVPEDILTPRGLIVNACAGLVKIDEESNVMSLVHKTTQEYFDRSGAELFPEAQQYIAQTCLKYLSLNVFSEGHSPNDGHFERRLRENALLGYAAKTFSYHIHGDAESNLHELALQFLLNDNKVSCASQVYFIEYRWWDRYSQEFPRDFRGLHYAAKTGLVHLIDLLL
jgi:hypothetical protein